MEIARDLIGKVLVTRIDNIYTSGIISETEAYNGIYDQACHAYNGRRTPRTEIMYSSGGTSYIYLCYGMHHLFNVITNQKNIPDAVLIRAVYPLDGVTQMLKRRNKDKIDHTLAGGPGTVAQSLGLHTGMNGTSLLQKKVWIEDRGIHFVSEEIMTTSRIGVESAGEAALYPYRFVLPYHYFKNTITIEQFRRSKVN